MLLWSQAGNKNGENMGITKENKRKTEKGKCRMAAILELIIKKINPHTLGVSCPGLESNQHILANGRF